MQFIFIIMKNNYDLLVIWPQICLLSLIREEIFLYTEAVSFNSCVQITHGLLDVSKFNVCRFS